MNEPISAVLEAMEAGRLYRSDSLDTPSDDGTETGSVPHDEDASDRVDSQTVLAEALQALSPAERDILRMRFVDEMSQSAIAKRIGVSQMQVSRYLAQSLQRMRSKF